MPSDKSPVLFGALMKMEDVYGVAETLTDADYLLLAEPTSATIEYLHDGERQQDARSAGILRRVRQSGRSLSAELSVLVRGAATGYTTDAVVPIEMDRFLRVAGHSATYDALEDSWTYAPISIGYESATLSLYRHGQAYPARGVHGGNLTIEAEAPGILRATTSVQGIFDGVVDAAVPDTTGFDVATLPMKFDGAYVATAIIAGWAGAIVRSFRMSRDMELTPRANGNIAGSHSGFAVGRRTVTVEMRVEATALATFDPYEALRLADNIALTARFGDDAPGKRADFATSYAQLTAVAEAEDGATSAWDLTFSLHGGDETDGDYTWTLS